jgi:uncharacterized membrane protein
MKLVSLPVACSLAVAMLMCAGGAGAQTIYRCGNEYTRIPCAEGRPLDTSDTPSAAQRVEARALVAQQRRQANEMENARRRQEAAVRPAGPASLGPRPPAPAASAASAPKKATAKRGSTKPKAGRKQAADDGDFIAGVPPVPREKKAPSR